MQFEKASFEEIKLMFSSIFTVILNKLLECGGMNGQEKVAKFSMQGEGDFL